MVFKSEIRKFAMKDIFKKMGLVALAGLISACLVSCGQSEDEPSGNGESEDQSEMNGGGSAEAGGEMDVAAQKAAYPLDTCVVGGDKLGMMGDPVEYNHEGRLVQFCCKDCIGEFEKDSAKYLAKLDNAKSVK